MAETKFKKSQLAGAAKELNDVLGCDPPIKTTAKNEQIEAKIKEAITLIKPAEDEFSEDTWAVLHQLNADEDGNPINNLSPANGAGVEQPAEDTSGEHEEGGTEPEEIDLPKEILSRKKLDHLKELAEERPEFKDLQLGDYTGLTGRKELISDMMAILGLDEKGNPLEDTGKSKPEPKPASNKKQGAADKKDTSTKKAKPKAEKTTRAGIMAKILKTGKPMSRKEMAEEMLAQYGGSENEANFQTGMYVRLLEALGAVEKDDKGRYTYLGS